MSNINNNKLIVILGPTASGKTEMAIKLAKKFNGEIVSADSRQIYKEIDIATAKPRRVKSQKSRPQRFASELARVAMRAGKNQKFIVNDIPHYLIDIINPDEDFSLAKYKKLAVEIIKDIQKRKKISFLVGGTGLYISAVVDNFEIPKVKPNKSIRKKLDSESAGNLFKKLKKVDPKAAENIGQNKRKLIRALEIYLVSKKTFSSQQRKGKLLFDVLQIGIKVPREKLYRKINQRVDQMIERGLEKEAKNLIDKGYNLNLPSMSGLGYRQIGRYLNSEIGLQEAVELIKCETRHYARRQMTWFRRDERIKWIEKYSEAEKFIKSFLMA
jgi:tRNA dimethylallyltransferase